MARKKKVETPPEPERTFEEQVWENYSRGRIGHPDAIRMIGEQQQEAATPGQ